MLFAIPETRSVAGASGSVRMAFAFSATAMLSAWLLSACSGEEPARVPFPTKTVVVVPNVEVAKKNVPDVQLVSRADDECCTDPGAVADCWWMDATRDGAVCTKHDDCASKNCRTDVTFGTEAEAPPNGWGLCGCDDDEDCIADGRGGACTEIGGQKVCGPSFCNGYMVCACWGGCEEGKSGAYETPGDRCSAKADGFPGECCEGEYPRDPAGGGIGFCSDACDGSYSGGDCVTDNDCTAQVPVAYSADCVQQVCDDGTCRFDFINSGADCADNVREDGEDYWGTEVRDDTGGVFSCFVGQCSTAGRCVATPVADNLYCDDDDANSCTDDICVAGLCIHDSSGTNNHPCNDLDTDACTLDTCNAGVCTPGGLKDCDDGNYCTYPDSCEDNDPEHLAWTCLNPPKLGNAEDYGYIDLDDCEDLMCTGFPNGGIETPTAADCSAYNPDGYDLQCNDYACVDGNGEDNCTLAYTGNLGSPCTDSDPCTVGDRCVDATDHGICEAVGDLDCDDLNECTVDTCSAGICVNTADVGASCDDGNLCTVDDICNFAGNCIPGAPPNCTALDDKCTDGVCDPGSGNCVASYLAAGLSCDADGDACTVNDTCDGAGTCNVGATKSCIAENDQCNSGVCNSTSGLCEKDPVADDTPCDADSNACTPTDTCQSGVCTPDTAVSCAADNDQCNFSTCNATTGACEFHNAALVGEVCNLDNDGCTVERCDGAVVGDEALICGSDSVVACSDGNQCTDDVCTSTGNLTHTCANPNFTSGTLCNWDSSGCTANDQCNGAGVCDPGTTIDAAACETELGVLYPGFDTDCNTGACVSTGDNTHECDPVALVTSPGDCNADFDACTLDTCGAFDPDSGAVCTAGGQRDCTAFDNQCQNGVCDDSGDYYNSTCEADPLVSGTACNADDDGCTVDDECDGAGACAAGTAAVCTPSDSCHTSVCTDTGANSYTCDETVQAGCCEVADDCIGQGYPCEGGGACNALVCTAGVCACNVLNAGDPCDELAPGTYPENCFSGVCNAVGDCEPVAAVLEDVRNNLCSDLFDPGNNAALLVGNTANLGDLGAGAADGAMLSATGSTLCGYNNYRASADSNCMEKTTGADLGVSGNDVVYSFRYWTPAATDYDLYSYVVKVEADFDVGVYLQDGIANANECPEGNNPALDESFSAVTRGEGYISYEIWTGVSGTATTGQPPTTAANYFGWYDKFQAPTNWSDNYVQRVRGYLIAPTTGTYTFWISGDDNCALYLSTNDASSNKVLLATVPGWSDALQWNKFPEQKSVGINLVAGGKYYIEALHKEGTGGDNMAVGWAKPGQSTAAPSEVIPGAQLSPWDGNDTPTGSGTISYERWNSVTGTAITAIPLTTAPSTTGTYALLEGPIPINAADNYGQRIRGYLIAPFTGAYTFFVAANAEGELWLSPDFDPANKVRVVRTTANAASRNWTTNADQKSAPVNLVRGGKYYIEGLHKEGSGNDNFAVGWSKPGESTATASEVVPGTYLMPWTDGEKSGYGYFSYDRWDGVTGTTVASIPVGTTPSVTGKVVGSLGITANSGDNYGRRLYGYIMAPLTGSYVFWLASNENGEFWLSTDEDPANKVRLANVPGFTNVGEWTKYAAQKSAAVNLVAGRYYYFEILHKEATGNDHVSLGWSKPGQSTAVPSETVDERQLAPWGLHEYDDISNPIGNICFDMWFGSYKKLAATPTSRPPDVSGAYQNFEGLRDWAGTPFFYQRIRGFVVAPTTGNYTFWLTSDDDAELWLSTDENPVNKVKIGSCPAWYPDNWLMYPTQKSSPIPLVAGRRYYVEVLHTDWYGQDHIQVGWSKPGQSTASGPSQIIPGANLDPLDEGCGSASVDVGWQCKNPYTNTPMPAVVEEECSEAGNTLNGQDCCDPCDVSCYNQCSRGYRTSDTALCDLCTGDCEVTWELPEEPFSCESVKPADAEYSGYNDMALAVIAPKPVDGGAWRNVMVYVDGSHGDNGNFYLTVEKRKQPGSVCERVNDNPRIIDVTDAPAAGMTYSSTVENLANSRHVTTGATTCGGYDCTEEWVKDGTCHSAAGTANAFWPAAESFKIYRDSGLQTYCITAAPAASNGLNPVVTVMEKAGTANPCFANLTVNTCSHANYLSTQSQVQFTAAAGTVYLIEVSRYGGLTRPCLNASGDNCDYTLTVKAGTCP